MNISELKSKRMTQDEAFALFDSLPAVTCREILGKWRGSELLTGHPMEGLLDAAGWHGKEFIDFETVHPLVFDRIGTSGKFFGNPALMPIKLPIHKLPKNAVRAIMRTFWRLMKTSRSRARLRELCYRGKTSAAMVYDQLAIIDCFRRLDENTLMGVMDIKGYFSSKSYFFLLERE